MTNINIGKGIEMAVDFERLPANAIGASLSEDWRCAMC
jgi:hypothetical protein